MAPKHAGGGPSDQSYERTPSPTTVQQHINTAMRGCPRFRILVIGKTGAGKSTICSRVFDVPYSDLKTGMEAVWKEIAFPQINDSIIFHDSGGFEAG